MWSKAKWVGVPIEEIRQKQIFQGDMNGRFAYYRCSFYAEEKSSLKVDISANSRYRLWVNEHPVLSGPCRNDWFRQYFDTVDLSGYLCEGKNVLAVQVLLCDNCGLGGQEDNRAGLFSIVSKHAGHLLAVEGDVCNSDGMHLCDISTGTADWKVWLDNSFFLTKGNVVNEYLGSRSEFIDFSKTEAFWKTRFYDDSSWNQASDIMPVILTSFQQSVGLSGILPVSERPIPLLYESEPKSLKETGSESFGGRDHITIPAGTTRKIIFQCDELLNGYLQLRFSKGKGAHIRILTFEKFTHPTKRIRRDDWVNGIAEESAHVDAITLCGGELCYEPFWYRTLRFLKLEIRTFAEPVELFLPQIRQTGYPLTVQNTLDSSVPWVKSLWEICVRTLKNCMMDSYMDCPFYEQMQYPMDTRLEALFTYACSNDVRLVTKALEDFHTSMLPVGLIQGKAPSSFVQVISTFSLHYIFMLKEYGDQTKNYIGLRKYLGDVDEILEYYHRHLDNDGLVVGIEYWPFVDWQSDWEEFYGVPAAFAKGASTIINLMYAYALEQAACLNEQVGRTGMASEYRSRKQQIISSVQNKCWDPVRELYQEGPSFMQYSQHAQNWAVLCGMLSGEKAKILLENSLSADVLQCGFSTCMEFFRACQKAGCYELTWKHWKRWIELLDEHCTTCPETPDNARSECHAWSALPMYEMVRALAGISLDEQNQIIIRSEFASLPDLPDLCGEVAVGDQFVSFHYEKNDRSIEYSVILPSDLAGYAVLADGRKIYLVQGKNHWSEKM